MECKVRPTLDNVGPHIIVYHKSNEFVNDN